MGIKEKMIGYKRMTQQMKKGVRLSMGKGSNASGVGDVNRISDRMVR
jgi:hypothetical protein